MSAQNEEVFMTFRTLMTIKAVVCLAFGPAMVIAPGFVMSILGITLGPDVALPAREYGAALCGNLLLCWFARNAGPSATRRAIILALLVYDAIGFLATLQTQLAGFLNPMGWLIIVIYLFFTLGFGYLWFKKPSIGEGDIEEEKLLL
jgi:hypothetical protein